MSISSINQTLDRIGQATFVDNQIKVESSRLIADFFLKFSNFSHGFNIENKSYTLFLRKGTANSIDNTVNPTFIVDLKQKIADLFVRFAKDWKWAETLEESCHEIPENEFALQKKIDIIGSSDFRSLLIFINEFHKLNLFFSLPIERIDVISTSEKLLEFSRVIGLEALYANPSPNVLTFICVKNDVQWLNDNKMLSEIIKTIIELSFLLVPESITNLDEFKKASALQIT